MEHVLETYARPYDPDCPVICMDEQPVQLVKETRAVIPGTKDHPKRVDYEYERNGTASIFMFAEPLSGRRQATARAQRTKSDWAQEVASLLDGRYADGKRITLVCDNLNTHTLMVNAFYDLDTGTRTIIPKLRKSGTTTIKTIFITHADLDHLVGIIDIIQQYKTEKRTKKTNASRTKTCRM